MEDGYDKEDLAAMSRMEGEGGPAPAPTEEIKVTTESNLEKMQEKMKSFLERAKDANGDATKLDEINHEIMSDPVLQKFMLENGIDINKLVSEKEKQSKQDMEILRGRANEVLLSAISLQSKIQDTLTRRGGSILTRPPNDELLNVNAGYKSLINRAENVSDLQRALDIFTRKFNETVDRDIRDAKRKYADPSMPPYIRDNFRDQLTHYTRLVNVQIPEVGHLITQRIQLTTAS